MLFLEGKFRASAGDPLVSESRADDSVRMFNYLSALLLFAVLGLVHYALIGTRFDRPWIEMIR